MCVYGNFGDTKLSQDKDNCEVFVNAAANVPFQWAFHLITVDVVRWIYGLNLNNIRLFIDSFRLKCNLLYVKIGICLSYILLFLQIVRWHYGRSAATYRGEIYLVKLKTANCSSHPQHPQKLIVKALLWNWRVWMSLAQQEDIFSSRQFLMGILQDFQETDISNSVANSKNCPHLAADFTSRHQHPTCWWRLPSAFITVLSSPSHIVSLTIVITLPLPRGMIRWF